jgi:iron complex outermembrane receptor protein
VALEDIERIEVLEGSAARVYGANAFSGAINIITKTSKKNNLTTRFSGGEHTYLNGGLSAAYNYENYQSYISLSKKQSDGYMQNTDFAVGNLFYQLKNMQNFGVFTLQLGYKDKSFGAQSFYTPMYPNQYEQTKTTLGSISFEKKGNWGVKSSVYWRRNQDKFELFRSDPPAWYKNHNYHLTDVIGSTANVSYKYKIFRSALGAEFRSENIMSNVLGLAMNDTLPVPGDAQGFFTKKAQRNSTSIFAEAGIVDSKFTLNTGALAIYYSDYKWKYYGGVDASLQLSKYVKWFASANQSLRLPTFTDLYYQGPTNIGNPDLLPEEAITYESGFKFLYNAFNFQAALYQSNGKNIIDWVRLNDTEKWQSQNLTKLQTRGVSFHGTFNFNKLINPDFFIQNITLNYAYNEVNKYSGEYESNYALDFMKSNASIALNFQLTKTLSWNFEYNYQDRNGSYPAFDFTNMVYTGEESYKPFSLINTKLMYTKGGLNLYMSADNLLNKKYADLGNIPMPGRWIKAGFSYTFDMN